MILVSPSVSVTGVGSPGASTDRALATWNGTSGDDLRSNSTLLISSSGTLDSNGADIRFLDQTFHIGVTKNQTSGTDYRPSRIFAKDAVVVGSLGVVGAPPYGVNTALVTGMAAFGNLAACYPVVGANTLMNSVSMGFFAWTKDTSFTNLPAFYNLNASATDFDVYFATIHRTTEKEDLLKFGGDGTLSFLKATSANLLWDTDGAGDIGSSDDGVTPNRPDKVFVKEAIVVNDYHLEPHEEDAGDSGTDSTIDWSLASSQKSTLTDDVTYTFSNPVVGGAYVLRVLTGTGGFSVTWPASVKWAGGSAPTITTTADRMDLISFYYDGENYYASYTQDYTP